MCIVIGISCSNICLHSINYSMFHIFTKEICRVCSFAGKALCAAKMAYKKIYTKFWFLIGNFQPDPHRLFGDFENPLGQHAVPSGQSEGRMEALRASLRPSLCPSGTACCPRGFSKSPPGSGDLGENSLTKIRISYIN